MPSFKTEYKVFSVITNPTQKETDDLKIRLFSSLKSLAKAIYNSRNSARSHINYELIDGVGRFEEMQEDCIKVYDDYKCCRREIYFSEMDLKTMYLVNECLYNFYMKRLQNE